jgi:hypothetical protein
MKNLKKYNQFIFENLGESTVKAIKALEVQQVVIKDPNQLPSLPGFYLDDEESSEDGIDIWCLYSPDGGHVATVTTERGDVGYLVTKVDIK